MDLKFILKYLIWQGYAVAGLAASLGPDVKQMKIRRYSPREEGWTRHQQNAAKRPYVIFYGGDGCC
jgi:hypothetical protein